MSSSSSHATVTYTFISSDDDLPSWVKDQPLPADASPTACLPGYIADCEPIEDNSEEDPKMDLVDYAVDEEEEESFEDEKKEKEEEHLTLADSALFVPNSIPSAVRPQIPLSSFIETQIVEYASAPTPPLPPPSLLTPLSSPLPLIPSSPDCRGAILKADMPPRKRVCFTTLSYRTPQQNRVAEKRNRTLIEAARTMLVDSKLPTTFWAEAINTDSMCKIRVSNSSTRIKEETLHIRFNEHTPNNVGSGPNWRFDIDALTKTINYQPVVAGTQSNGNAEPKSSYDTRFKPSNNVEKKVNEVPRQDTECKDQEKDSVNNTNKVSAVSSPVNTARNEVNAVGRKSSIELHEDLNMPELEDISIFEDSNEDVFSAEANLNNLESTFQVSPIPATRIHKDHPLEQVIRDLCLAPQTMRMSKHLEEHGLVSTVNQRTNHKDLQNCLFSCFLSQMEPKKIEAIRLFLAYASFIDFVVYQMDMKSAFLYENIKEEVYVCQPPGFEDPNFPDKVYKVEKALYGLLQAPRAWYETLSTYLLDNGFHRGKIDKTLFIKRHKDDILLVQVYVDDIIFGSTKKELCNAFEKLMHEMFQMSSIRELTFFLGLQCKKQTVVANSTTEAEYVVASSCRG
nr:putative ribonuclease H-like domain-containing protein [Tanacetum cinerariifolium]